MDPIVYIDRTDGNKKIESVYGANAIAFLYGPGRLGALLGTLSARLPFVSATYGWWQKQRWTKCKIFPFITRFHIDSDEFLVPVAHFSSFNDFFIRKLKPEMRPLNDAPAVIPADGRYYFYQDLTACDGYIIKGKKFSLEALLKDKHLAERYAHGSLMMARLCPSDYHRFHFPCDGTHAIPRLINGPLYSVNPFAVKQHLNIFTENKRVITEISSPLFGKVLYIEVGATNVGSILHTSDPGKTYKKGEEKGYFSFGASALIVIFEKGKIVFDEDLLEATQQGNEIRCLVGQSMGKSVD